jgi:hypothetical protein
MEIAMHHVYGWELNFSTEGLGKPMVIAISETGTTALVGKVIEGSLNYSDTSTSFVRLQIARLSLFGRGVSFITTPGGPNIIEFVFRKGEFLIMNPGFIFAIATNSEEADEVKSEDGLKAAFENCRKLRKLENLVGNQE